MSSGLTYDTGALIASDRSTATLRRPDIKPGELADCPLRIGDMAEARLVLTDDLIDAALGRSPRSKDGVDAEPAKKPGVKRSFSKGSAPKMAPKSAKPSRKPDRRKQDLN